MKKFLILFLISFLIIWCSKSNEKNETTESTWTSTWEVSKWTWKVEEIFSWKVEEVKKVEDKKEENIKNNRKLILKNKWNVYLLETWKEDIVLTTRAKWYKDCLESNLEGFYEYKILVAEWKYWLVGRIFDTCESFWPKNLYWINLNNSVNDKTALIDISDNFDNINSRNNLSVILNEYEWSFEKWSFKVNWDKLYITRDKKTLLPKRTDEALYIASFDDLKKDWFIDKWDYFEKVFDLQKMLPDKKEEIVENENKKVLEIKENKNNIPNEYKPENLLKNWYKVNNLWETKEYYKKEEKNTGSKDSPSWNTTYKTIYIKWNKFLYIESIIYWGNLRWAGWSITIKDKNWSKTIEEYDEILSSLWIEFSWEIAVQSIFKRQWTPKIFVNWDLTAITIKTDDWNKQVIWRWK